MPDQSPDTSYGGLLPEDHWRNVASELGRQYGLTSRALLAAAPQPEKQDDAT